MSDKPIPQKGWREASRLVESEGLRVLAEAKTTLRAAGRAPVEEVARKLDETATALELQARRLLRVARYLEQRSWGIDG